MVPSAPESRLEDVKSLWMGQIQSEWSEAFVASLFGECGKRFKVKLMRDRTTGTSAGYCFLEFESHADAESVLTTFSERTMPGSSLPFSLRWGGGHGRSQRVPQQAGSGPDASIFVGDLDYGVTEAQLHDLFATKYRSVLSTKLVMDLGSGTSKGFGFVKFADAAERDRAAVEMNGHYIGDRPIRCTVATAREDRHDQQAARPSTLADRSLISSAPKATEEGENTCVFVGGLDESVTPDMLRHHFGLLGDIAYIRIPPGRGCGFVGFVHRKNAEAAISTLQGLRINGYKVRLSWGSMRQGPKKQQPVRPGAPRGPVVSTLPVTQVKKEHKTPFGTLTNDFLEKLPDPKPPWEKPPPPAQADAENADPGDAATDPHAAKPAAVPMSPYVAQLKARYETYRAAVPVAKRPKRTLGDLYSLYSDRTSRPAKRPLTADEINRENHAYTTDFLARTLTILSSGLLLPLDPPKPLADHYDHFTDTPMAAYMRAEALQQPQPPLPPRPPPPPHRPS